MSKYSITALVLAVVVGFVAGAWFANNLYRGELIDVNNRNKQLEKETKIHLHTIDSASRIIISMDKVIQLDDSIIGILHESMQHQDSVTQSKRDENFKSTPNARKDWLIDRYTKPQ